MRQRTEPCARGASSYRPKPGSVCYRTIAWLEQQPVGADFLISKLADGVGADAATLHQNIMAAIEAGSILKRPPKGQDRPYFFSLNPLQHPEYREPAAKHSNGADAPQLVPGEAAAAWSTKVKGTATPKDGGSPPEIEMEEFGTELGVIYPRPARPKAAPTLRCALWSDGTLTIEHGDEVLEFTADEAKTLRMYLRDGVTP